LSGSSTPSTNAPHSVLANATTVSSNLEGSFKILLVSKNIHSFLARRFAKRSVLVIGDFEVVEIKG